MDIFEPVKELTEKINSMNPSLDIDKIIIHIERAFELFTQGITTGEEQNYTDVIYRCNQAFEGCSRQAFLVLAEKNEEELRKTQAWKIEKYLIDNKILNERLLPLFQNYREKWRNESSHNFKLFFKEEEAYIAILNICSYAYVLLNQIALKVSSSDVNNIEPLKSKEEFSLLENIEKVTETFLKEVDLDKYRKGSTIPRISENQFIGIYSSYLEKKLPMVNVLVDEKLNSESKLRTDIMLEFNDEKIIIEIKSLRVKNSQVREMAKEQLLKYLSTMKNSKGILFIFDSFQKMNELKTNNFNIQKDNVDFELKVFEGVK
ncbi:GxxExxY protein [Wenyingzhuangia sp. IMCC45574]